MDRPSVAKRASGSRPVRGPTVRWRTGKVRHLAGGDADPVLARWFSLGEPAGGHRYAVAGDGRTRRVLGDLKGHPSGRVRSHLRRLLAKVLLPCSRVRPFGASPRGSGPPCRCSEDSDFTSCTSFASLRSTPVQAGAQAESEASRRSRGSVMGGIVDRLRARSGAGSPTRAASWYAGSPMRFTFTMKTRSGGRHEDRDRAETSRPAEEKVKRENPTCAITRVEAEVAGGPVQGPGPGTPRRVTTTAYGTHGKCPSSAPSRHGVQAAPVAGRAARFVKCSPSEMSAPRRMCARPGTVRRVVDVQPSRCPRSRAGSTIRLGAVRGGMDALQVKPRRKCFDQPCGRGRLPGRSGQRTCRGRWTPAGVDGDDERIEVGEPVERQVRHVRARRTDGTAHRRRCPCFATISIFPMLERRAIGVPDRDASPVR